MPSWGFSLPRGSPHPGGQVHAVVEVPEPEEVREAVRDVEGTQLLVPQTQEAQDAHVVLVPSECREKWPF